MRRGALIGLVVVAALLAPALAAAEGWHSAQPPPPPAPEGETAVGLPVPLGHVGQISFWAPNHGLLITSGTEVVPAGLYYYNGVSWSELSTVCGGSDGRIAWAGENDFWTVSNQQAGQEVHGIGTASEDIALCHFENGEVVASYAEPIGEAGSYEQMDAAACSEPDDCWFAGETLSAGLNTGAFHLHWNGQTLTPVPSLQTLEPSLEDPPFAVRSLVSYQGHFYESVQPEAAAGAGQILIHKIDEGSSKPFQGMIVEGAVNEHGETEPFSFSGVTPLSFSADESQLWAAGGATALLLNASDQFQQLRLEDPEGTLAPGITAVAAEPGGQGAWVSLASPSSSAKVTASIARIQADGSVSAATTLPEAGEGLAGKGPAGAIDCPAAGDCWLATAPSTSGTDAQQDAGWLFHLGGDYPEDDDPYFEQLITYQPDAGLPFLAAEEFPENDAGETAAKIPAPPPPPAVKEKQTKAYAALFSHVKVKLIKGTTTLALTFTLVTKSRVKLLALRHKHTVAHTKRYTLKGGRHTLELKLERRKWPTKLKLQVKAIGKVPLVNAPTTGKKESESAGEANVEET